MTGMIHYEYKGLIGWNVECVVINIEEETNHNNGKGQFLFASHF